MKVSKEMYTTLFNSITDVQKKIKLANKIINEAILDLEKAQICTEEIYITTDDIDSLEQ